MHRLEWIRIWVFMLCWIFSPIWKLSYRKTYEERVVREVVGCNALVSFLIPKKKVLFVSIRSYFYMKSKISLCL